MPVRLLAFSTDVSHQARLDFLKSKAKEEETIAFSLNEAIFQFSTYYFMSCSFLVTVETPPSAHWSISLFCSPNMTTTSKYISLRWTFLHKIDPRYNLLIDLKSHEQKDYWHLIDDWKLQFPFIYLQHSQGVFLDPTKYSEYHALSVAPTYLGDVSGRAAPGIHFQWSSPHRFAAAHLHFSHPLQVTV